MLNNTNLSTDTSQTTNESLGWIYYHIGRNKEATFYYFKIKIIYCIRKKNVGRIDFIIGSKSSVSVFEFDSCSVISHYLVFCLMWLLQNVNITLWHSLL